MGNAKKPQNSAVLQVISVIASGGGERFCRSRFPFFDQDFGCFIQALPALRALTHLFVHSVRIAHMATRHFPQLAFPNGIADAYVHALQVNANGLQ